MPATGHDSGPVDVIAAMDGDDQAQSALWRSHRRWLAAILLAHKPREIEVEDLMQDVAVKFVTKLHTLRDPDAFRPWLRQIALNAAREAARSIRRERSDRESFDPAMMDGNDDYSGIEQTREVAEVRDEAAELLTHAQSLPPDFREPVLLRCVQGLSCKQIAEILELPVTTVETRLSRGRRMLRDEWLRRTRGDNDASSANQ